MWSPPAPGHWPVAFPRGPAPRASLPAALPQALRATYSTRAPPCPACRLSHTQPELLTLRYGAGNARAASAAPVLAPDPAIGPHSGIRDSEPESLPSGSPAWPPRLRRASRGAFGASGSAASVFHPFSGPTPSVQSPLRTVPTILLSALRLSALKLPAPAALKPTVTR